MGRFLSVLMHLSAHLLAGTARSFHQVCQQLLERGISSWFMQESPRSHPGGTHPWTSHTLSFPACLECIVRLLRLVSLFLLPRFVSKSEGRRLERGLLRD